MTPGDIQIDLIIIGFLFAEGSRKVSRLEASLGLSGRILSEEQPGSGR